MEWGQCAWCRPVGVGSLAAGSLFVSQPERLARGFIYLSSIIIMVPALRVQEGGLVRLRLFQVARGGWVLVWVWRSAEGGGWR